jgi:hypothetical protein
MGPEKAVQFRQISGKIAPFCNISPNLHHLQLNFRCQVTVCDDNPSPEPSGQLLDLFRAKWIGSVFKTYVIAAKLELKFGPVQVPTD